MRLARTTAILLGLLAWAVLPVRAESPVNFSGTFELDRGRSVLPSRASAIPAGELTLVIAHKGETLKIERQVKIMGMRRSATWVFYTDGRESSNQTPRGRTVISRSYWDGTSIVIVTRRMLTRNGKTEPIETTEVNHLSEDGKLLIVDSTTRRAGSAPPEHVSLVFVRK